MHTFQLAITGDFLNERGKSAYGDLGFGAIEFCPFIEHHYIMDHAPRANDPTYCDKLYSMEVSAAHLRNMGGLIVLRPYIRTHAFAGAENRDLRTEVQKLKDATPAGVLLGSGSLATVLDRLDLIDEYVFLVHPRIAGHGPTLYQGGLPGTRRTSRGGR